MYAITRGRSMYRFVTRMLANAIWIYIYRCTGILTSLFILVAVATRWHNLDLATLLTFGWAHSLRMYKIKGGAGVRSSCPTFRAYSTHVRAMNADLPWKRGLPSTREQNGTRELEKTTRMR